MPEAKWGDLGKDVEEAMTLEAEAWTLEAEARTFETEARTLEAGSIKFRV